MSANMIRKINLILKGKSVFLFAPLADVCYCYLFYGLLFCSVLFPFFLHFKNAGLFQPKFGPNVDKPSNWVNILNDIFNPKFGFVHILPILFYFIFVFYLHKYSRKAINSKSQLCDCLYCITL